MCYLLNLLSTYFLNVCNNSFVIEGDISSPLTPRRAARHRNKPKKYKDFIETSPVKRRFSTIYQNDSSDDEFNLQNPAPKPKGKYYVQDKNY